MIYDLPSNFFPPCCFWMLLSSVWQGGSRMTVHIKFQLCLRTEEWIIQLKLYTVVKWPTASNHLYYSKLGMELWTTMFCGSLIGLWFACVHRRHLKWKQMGVKVNAELAWTYYMQVGSIIPFPPNHGSGWELKSWLNKLASNTSKRFSHAFLLPLPGNGQERKTVLNQLVPVRR